MRDRQNKTAGLSYEDVTRQAKGGLVTIYKNGLEVCGHCWEEKMRNLFEDCVFVKLHRDVYQVTGKADEL